MYDPYDAIEVETGLDPQFAVIWLHGLGADGSDFVPVVPELELDRRYAIRFVFPHAPLAPVTCNGGYVMRSWYDIISLDATSREIDEAGIIAARQTVRALIARENQRGIATSRIILAGFSQGGAVAYTTALTHSERLGGLIALSTYIPSPALILGDASVANQSISVFIGHGRMDDVVSPELGVAARGFLQDHGYPFKWHDYPITHSVCLEEIQDIGAWLNARLNACLVG